MSPPRPPRRLVFTLLGASLASALAPGDATAQAPSPAPYQVDWTLDLALTGAATALWILPPLFERDVIRPVCPCRSADVVAIDRFATRQHSAAAGTASDLAVAGFLVLPVAFETLDVGFGDGRWRGLVRDLMVTAEAIAINGALNEVVKFAVRRPRPLAYDQPAGSAVVDDPQSYLSFYSGHTSTAFAAGMAYATTFSLRHPDSARRPFVYAGAVAGGGAVGLLRVLAGKHFPTDVLASALVGSAIGLVVPLLHRRGASALVVPAPGGGMVMTTGSF